MIVELAVSSSAILAGKDLQFLVLRSDNAKHLPRVIDRDLLVISPVRNKERAGNAMSNRLDLKLFDVLHRRLHGVGAGDVHQLKHRGCDRATDSEPALPDRMVIIVRAPRDDGAQPLFEGGRAGDIISAEAAA